MKLCTFEHRGLERVGLVIDDSNVADVTVAYASILQKRGETRSHKLAEVLVPPSMIEIIEGGDSSLKAIREIMEILRSEPNMKGPKDEPIVYPLAEVTLKAPVPNPPKMLFPNFNQKKDLGRIIRPLTEHPFYCIKLRSCITGPYDPIEIPGIGVVFSEVEVGAVIGKRGKNIPIERTEEYIFGYTVVNDITAVEMRNKQEWAIIKMPDGEEMRLTTAARYKCFDTFAPMGPWLVTRDAIPDIHSCNMESRINNEVDQKGTTADMVFKFPQLLSYFSVAHTLEPGDIISSGTCPIAPERRKVGKVDLNKIEGVLESEVEGIGILRNPIKHI